MGSAQQDRPPTRRYPKPALGPLPDATPRSGRTDTLPTTPHVPAASARDSHRPADLRLEIAMSWLGIAVTLVATVMVARELLGVLWVQLVGGRWGAASGHLLFTVIVAFLIYGGLVYQLTRLNYLRRRRAHHPAGRDEIEALYDGEAPALSILIPAYKEEPGVVLQTLMSAALQDYPKRRVVLLIDDPPEPQGGADLSQLEAARRLPRELQALLALPARRFSTARQAFHRRCASGTLDARRELQRLASLYEEAASWFTARIEAFDCATHADRLFLDKVLRGRENGLRRRAFELRRVARRRRTVGLSGRIHREFNRLATLFAVEITSFERKRYANLSHEPNKAMNLNSYIGLLGQRLRERRHAGRLHLEPAAGEPADVDIAAADYLVTLDADSVIVPDYALRLVHLAEQPGNERIAVAQTPYSAFPGARGALERIAGATTDIQYIIHQGFTASDATYWVGANALLRTSALQDIAVTVEERGFPVSVFIQDRTVIEDTESTVDLIERGWRLYNYPERLAYSATPPDFGALVIQRRRWANGGLIILPKLLCYLARRPLTARGLAEAFLRVHYLSSITAVNFGLLIILAVPFTESIRSFWLPLSALSYFLLYARDLSLTGYRAADVLRVYALNLVLIPVNLGGVLKSIQQAWTREKIPFGRTPKVDGRTAAAPLYLLAVYAILCHWLIQAGIDATAGLWFHALFAAANAGALFYGIAVFIGFRESLDDLRAGARTIPTGGQGPHLAASPGTPGLPAPVPVTALEAPRGGLSRDWVRHPLLVPDMAAQPVLELALERPATHGLGPGCGTFPLRTPGCVAALRDRQQPRE